MEIPSVMFVEIAMDWLRQLRADPQTKTDLDRQRRELRSFGDVRAQQLGASGLSEDFQTGYELGLQTARALLRGNVTAAKNQITL